MLYWWSEEQVVRFQALLEKALHGLLEMESKRMTPLYSMNCPKKRVNTARHGTKEYRSDEE